MSRVTRREFLNTGGKAAAGLAAAASIHTMLRDAQAAEANERLNVALIGCGGMGRYKFNNFMDTKLVDMLAVCDVDDSQAAIAAADVEKKLGHAPKKFRDFRQVLDMKELNAVIVATPDHWHAAPMLLACQAEKDVYCEKPCCHNIREGRAMVSAAEKYKRVVQVGTHQRSITNIQEAREFVRAGKLGTVAQTESFTYGNESPGGMGPASTELPAGVDYDRWLGPAPVVPFNSHRFHNTWRWFFDYAAGMVGDWNVHLQDILMWTMGAQYPISVSCLGGKFVLQDDRTTPDMMQAAYEFGPTDIAPKGFVQTYTMRKYSGKPWDAGGYGMDFHGTNGKLHLTRDERKLEGDKKDWKNPKSPWRVSSKSEKFEGADAKGHMAHVMNFLECIKNRGKPIASIDQHYYTVTACHLANVSLRVGRRIFWDHQKELCFHDRELKVEDKDANALLTREYRKGYELPQV